jgi:small-conductance mechanosensitive channel
MKKLYRLIVATTLLILLAFSDAILHLTAFSSLVPHPNFFTVRKILVIACSTWIFIEVIRVLKRRLLKRYDFSYENNLKSRKLHTQIDLLEKVIVFVVIVISVGLILISIEGIREIGIGIFASAGVVGIIIGLSAQKITGAVLAGIQIAITQPFRIEEAIVVEGEWGWIEEINLTYVVVRIWDKRRLVLPSNYFLEKPFQNWTRTTSDILGTVFIYSDYTLPLDALREELDRILEDNPLWDGKAKVIQVTDSKQNYMESRILVSAKNSPTAWELRVQVREKMIAFIQKNYPQSLPKIRVALEKN